MDTRLFLIEGLPGSGKTTTAEALMDVLEDRQIDARLYLEGDARHPADYEGVAYLEHDEWKEITERYALLEPVRFAETYEDHVLLSYRRWQSEMEVPVETIEFLQAKDVYELPFELHRSLILEKWETFVSDAAESDMTYIFECCYLQNPLTVGLVKHDLSESVLQDYVERLAAIVSPLRPTLIYVDQSEVERSFRKALGERPVEWSEGFVSYYTGQGYGQSRKLQGVEGTLEILKARQAIERRMLEVLPLEVMTFDNQGFSKDSRRAWLRRLVDMKENPVSPVEG